jgi:hypothetical protein
MATQKTKHRRFPRMLERFQNLEGGVYGTLDLVATTAEQLELQTGDDYVRFDRAQATQLRDAIDRFLAFDKHDAEGAELEEVVAAVAEVEAEATEGRPRRHRHRS